jgi:hypothetical protein
VSGSGHEVEAFAPRGGRRHHPEAERHIPMSTLIGIPFWVGVFVGVVLTLIIQALTG